MSGQSDTDQLHMQDAPDHVFLLPTQEQQKDIRYVDANRTKETRDDDSTGDYSYTPHCLDLCVSDKFRLQIMHNICRRDQACYQSQNLA
jgi:hypothetical protein